MLALFNLCKKKLTNYFSPAKYFSRIKLFFNKEKVQKSGEVSYKVAFEFEIERTEKNSSPTCHAAEL